MLTFVAINVLNVLPSGGRLLINSPHILIVLLLAVSLYPHKELSDMKIILVTTSTSTRSSAVPPVPYRQPTGGLEGICNEHQSKTIARAHKCLG